MRDLKKWQELRDCAALICHAIKGDLHLVNDLAGTPEEVEVSARSQAAALARELFPPMAKPLVWNPWGEDIFSNVILGKSYSIVPEDSAFYAEFGGSKGKQIGAAFATLDEAKAFCESHHQSRFKELLA